AETLAPPRAPCMLAPKMATALRTLGARGVGLVANAVWPLLLAYGERFPGPPFQPRWAPAPLQRKKNRTFPPLGWPRRPDSLCPVCVRQGRARVVAGGRDWSGVRGGAPGGRRLVGLHRRKPGRDPCRNRRTGRQDRDAEGMQAARPFRGRD